MTVGSFGGNSPASPGFKSQRLLALPQRRNTVELLLRPSAVLRRDVSVIRHLASKCAELLRSRASGGRPGLSTILQSWTASLLLAMLGHAGAAELSCDVQAFHVLEAGLCWRLVDRPRVSYLRPLDLGYLLLELVALPL